MAGHHPTNKLIGREPIPHQNTKNSESFPTHPCRQAGTPRISHPFKRLSRSEGQVTHVLLTRSPLTHPPTKKPENRPVRLACVKHAASVRPEPGSNSPKKPNKNNKTKKKQEKAHPPQTKAGKPWHKKHTHYRDLKQHTHTRPETAPPQTSRTTPTPGTQKP